MRYFNGDIAAVQAFVGKPGVRQSAQDPMLSIASINVQFANGGVGTLITQRGDAAFGYGGWWSYEQAGRQRHPSSPSPKHGSSGIVFSCIPEFPCRFPEPSERRPSGKDPRDLPQKQIP